MTHAGEVVARGLGALGEHDDDGRRNLQLGDLVALDGGQKVFVVELGHDVDGRQRLAGEQTGVQLAVGVVQRQQADPAVARPKIPFGVSVDVAEVVDLLDVGDEAGVRHADALGEACRAGAEVDGGHGVAGLGWGELGPLPFEGVLVRGEHGSPVGDAILDGGFIVGELEDASLGDADL